MIKYMRDIWHRDAEFTEDKGTWKLVTVSLLTKTRSQGIKIRNKTTRPEYEKCYVQICMLY